MNENVNVIVGIILKDIVCDSSQVRLYTLGKIYYIIIYIRMRISSGGSARIII